MLHSKSTFARKLAYTSWDLTWDLIVASAHIHIDKCRALRGNDRTPSFLLFVCFVNEAIVFWDCTRLDFVCRIRCGCSLWRFDYLFLFFSFSYRLSGNQKIRWHKFQSWEHIFECLKINIRQLHIMQDLTTIWNAASICDILFFCSTWRISVNWGVSDKWFHSESEESQSQSQSALLVRYVCTYKEFDSMYIHRDRHTYYEKQGQQAWHTRHKH